MQLVIEKPTTVCDSGGIKCAASPLSSCLSSSAQDHHPISQHAFRYPLGQDYYHYKRLRTSILHSYLRTQNNPIVSTRASPLAVWHDFRNREFKIVEETRKPSDQISNLIANIATPFSVTQQSKPGIERRGPGDCLPPNGRFQNFFTKASLETTRGLTDLDRVQIDGGSPFNLVLWSVATNHDLMLYSDKTLAITIADRQFKTNHYFKFTIRVAGQNTMIHAGVISGLQTILLGHDWIRRVRLLKARSIGGWQSSKRERECWCICKVKDGEVKRGVVRGCA